MRLLTIDPGIKTLGWAVFEDSDLLFTGVSRAREKRIDSAALAHLESLLAFTCVGGYPYAVVLERMTYRQKARSVPPQDLMDVNLVGGIVAAGCKGADGVLWTVTPAEWKGSVPRDVEQARSAHVLSKAEARVLAAVKPVHLAHNAWSAVGIGLAYLGRAHKKNLTKALTAK